MTKINMSMDLASKERNQRKKRLNFSLLLLSLHSQLETIFAYLILFVTIPLITLTTSIVSIILFFKTGTT